jgi:enamine deaminase RidA (YjgF/YER057c/UK114 family)
VAASSGSRGTATHDASGNVLDGDFEGQCGRRSPLAATIVRAGATLQDIVTMTVFIIDSRYGDRFIELRKPYFPAGYPASALITVAGFAKASMMVEVQCVAVIPEESRMETFSAPWRMRSVGLHRRRTA